MSLISQKALNKIRPNMIISLGSGRNWAYWYGMDCT